MHRLWINLCLESVGWSARASMASKFVQSTPGLFSYLSALAAGAPLGEAVAVAGLDQSALVHALGFVFQEALVCAVTLKVGHSAP